MELRSRAWCSAILIYIAIFLFSSEIQTVHGRILAVNMAHLRKKSQTAGNETDGEHAFKEIRDCKNHQRYTNHLA